MAASDRGHHRLIFIIGGQPAMIVDSIVGLHHVDRINASGVSATATRQRPTWCTSR
ncbi:MAG TPA: hypothetical protein VFX16_10470 [Pseudonocardiaceae bacterium]|nr:hypothetical protein [Pseudonocardiaceae bacterium]